MKQMGKPAFLKPSRKPVGPERGHGSMGKPNGKRLGLMERVIIESPYVSAIAKYINRSTGNVLDSESGDWRHADFALIFMNLAYYYYEEGLDPKSAMSDLVGKMSPNIANAALAIVDKIHELKHTPTDEDSKAILLNFGIQLRDRGEMSEALFDEDSGTLRRPDDFGL